MPRPLELTQLDKALKASYQVLLPLQPNGSPAEKERNFLSRAQCAFFLEHNAGLSQTDAAAAVVDASGDGGIDAVHVDQSTQTLWLVQSKYIESGDGEPDLGGVLKFLEGIENVLQGEFTTFQSNPSWTTVLPKVRAAISGSQLEVRCAILYSSFRLMSEDRKRAIEKLLARLNEHSEVCTIVSANLTSLHGYLLAPVVVSGVEEVEIEIYNPSFVSNPYPTYLGQVKASELVRLSKQHGEALVAGNIRRYKGKTDVNELIQQTALDSPERFFYLNNGVTAYCTRADVPFLKRAANPRPIKLKGFSIINGAQTLGSLARAEKSAKAISDQCFVAVKIISLQKTDDEAALATDITRSANFQNTIGPRDFVALHDLQSALAVTLRLDGIHYHFRDSEDSPPPDSSNLSFDEAVIALACAEQENECDLLARVLSNRRSLYSFENVYTGQPFSTRYERLFPATLSALRTWRAVQTYRQVFTQLLDDARAASGIRRKFFENCRPLVLNAIYLKLRPESGESLALTPAEESDIRAKASEYAEKLWAVAMANGYVSNRATPIAGELYEQARSFQSVFRNASDCKSLRSKLLAVL